MIYLDNSATTPVRPEVVAYLSDNLMTNFGNASALYDLGIRAEKTLAESRHSIARSLGAQKGEILFTSGGSESNNLALRGVAETYARRGKHIVISAVEHPSVRLAAEDLASRGFELTALPVDGAGRIALATLEHALRSDTILVSVMMVNNEVGTVMPIAEIAAAVRRKSPDAFFHVDGVQAYGRLAVDVKKLDIDLFSLSGHKIGGPKGIGALYVRDGIRLHPLIFGGGQEKGIRGGTENICSIGALALAAKLSLADRPKKDEQLINLKQTLLYAMEAEQIDLAVNGGEAVPYILNLTFPNVTGEVLLHFLEGEGIYVSQGSACHAKSKKPSETLAALGLDKEAQLSSIRFSFGEELTKEDMYTVAAAVKRGVEMIAPLRKG